MNDFNLQFDAQFFEKADAPEGRKRRIGGIASIETQDRQKETLLQRGLDFSEFVNHGWFNDNHSKITTDILGYPEDARFFQKGETLPNGEIAKAPGHWVEGYLLNTKKADQVWELAQALKGTPRRLGFSVEGKIQQRNKLDKSVVAKALVREVAITKAPVNTDALMDVFVKSLEPEEDTNKALGIGSREPGIKAVGPQTGEDAGKAVVRESLEGALKITECSNTKKKKKKKVKKGLNDAEAFAYLSDKLIASPLVISRLIAATRALKKRGVL